MPLREYPHRVGEWVAVRRLGRVGAGYFNCSDTNKFQFTRASAAFTSAVALATGAVAS